MLNEVETENDGGGGRENMGTIHLTKIFGNFGPKLNGRFYARDVKVV